MELSCISSTISSPERETPSLFHPRLITGDKQLRCMKRSEPCSENRLNESFSQRMISDQLFMRDESAQFHPLLYISPSPFNDHIMVAPTPDFYEHSLPKILRRAHRRPGINDALIRPHDNTQRDLTFSTLLRNRAVMRGRIRTLVVMVDFQDVKFDNRQTKRHYETLWFGPRPTNSVNSYFQDVSKEKVSIYGEVKGPYTLEHDMSYYANHRSGLGNRTPNAMTMAREAVAAAEKDGVNFGLYDNDRDGFVDSFVIVHAGRGAEHTRSGDDIWSHKGVLQDLGPFRILLNAFKEQFREDQPAETNVFAYLTIPADCKLGVCVHELGHLAFGWPDLYDGDYSSSGIGNWCLMASGSYNGDENNPAEPSAWCKLKQKWVDPIPIKNNQKIELKDVKDENKVVQIWKENLFGSEYFLLEYRKQKGRDADLPGSGLLMWHIDEEQDDNRSEMTHYKVALMQGDGERDMERGENLGDPGDPFPGFNRIDFIGPDTNPSTNDWSGSPTGIIISDIRELKDSITFTISY